MLVCCPHLTDSYIQLQLVVGVVAIEQPVDDLLMTRKLSFCRGVCSCSTDNGPAEVVRRDTILDAGRDDCPVGGLQSYNMVQNGADLLTCAMIAC